MAPLQRRPVPVNTDQLVWGVGGCSLGTGTPEDSMWKRQSEMNYLFSQQVLSFQEKEDNWFLLSTWWKLYPLETSFFIINKFNQQLMSLVFNPNFGQKIDRARMGVSGQMKPQNFIMLAFCFVFVFHLLVIVPSL